MCMYVSVSVCVCVCVYIDVLNTFILLIIKCVIVTIKHLRICLLSRVRGAGGGGGGEGGGYTNTRKYILKS